MSGRGERLRRCIAEEIRRAGPVSFERFMERALYEPGLGYYAAAGEEGGPGVDFRTSPQLGPVFARLLAVQVEECWRLLGEPDNLHVVEFGAGSSALALGILEALREAGAWPRAGVYLAVDPHARAGAEGSRGEGGAAEAAGRGAAGPLRSADETEALAALAGGDALVLSNEFVDALPVRRFVVRSGRPREVRVGLAVVSTPGPAEPVFVEVERDAEEQEVREALRDLPPLPEGFQLEINLRARAWMEKLAVALRRGYVLTLDYGYRRSERFRPERAAGTLLAYRRHRVERDLLARAGEQDLTSHADFDDLIDAGRRAGLVPLGVADQMRFLTALAKRAAILEGEPASPQAWRDRQSFKELIQPGGMGTTFRVLVQGKSVPPAPLCGLEDPFGV